MKWYILALALAVALAQDECYKDNVYHSGGDLGSFYTPNKKIEECLEACTRHPECWGFDFRKSTSSAGKCWIKEDKGQRQRSSSTMTFGDMACFKKYITVEESDFVNVAQLAGVKVEQSGERSGGKKERAIDGNYNTNWDLKGCTYSYDSRLNWWKITLDKIYKIDHIIVYGVEDDPSNNGDGKMNKVMIKIEDRLCEQVSGVEDYSSTGHVFTCGDDPSKRVGQHVLFENYKNKIVLCEVQIMVNKKDLAGTVLPENPPVIAGQPVGDFYNVAYGKETDCTTHRDKGTCEKAVDGWSSQEWNYAGTCWFSHQLDMNKNSPEMWKVKLGRAYKIDHINIWLNDRNTKYVEGALVWVGDNICGRIDGEGDDAEEMQSFECAAGYSAGDSVTISQNSRDWISICEVQVLVKKEDLDTIPEISPAWPGERGTGEMEGYTNVALQHRLPAAEGVYAEQSSTSHDGSAWRAIDGNTNGKYWDFRSVTHTNGGGQNWWKLHLGRNYKIHAITIYNRAESSTRLNTARVIVGVDNIVEDSIAIHKDVYQPIVITTSEDETVVGDSVTVQRLNEVLSLAEVQVWVANEDVIGDEPETPVSEWNNVALKKETSSSTHRNQATSDKAVDGWTTQKWDSGSSASCWFSSRLAMNPGGPEWWTVSLGRAYKIDHINIWLNERDTWRVDGALVRVGKNICGRIDGDGDDAEEMQTFKCADGYSVGESVTVSLNSQDYISLCEVQVMVKGEDMGETIPEVSPYWPGERGSGETEGYTNVALQLTSDDVYAEQSVTLHDGSAWRAVDGNNKGKYWDWRSVTHTDHSGHQWWRVHLGRNYKIHAILIYNRVESSTRLNTARVVVGVDTIVEDSITIHKDVKQPIVITIPGDDTVVGDSVTVERLNDVMQLAEVEVWVANKDVLADEPAYVAAAWKNVALKKPTTQSSNNNVYTSDRAVDNFPESLTLRDGSCSCTRNEEFNWWEVDLQEAHNIDHIVIIGSTENNANRYIHRATVSVDGRTVGAVLYEDGTEKQTQWIFPLYGLRGQKVRVMHRGDHLVLCEVQVMMHRDYEADPNALPEPINRGIGNLATLNNIFVKSYASGGDPEKAVDGDISSDYFEGSCYMSGAAQNGNELNVMLGEGQTVGFVAVYPRLDMDPADYIDQAEVSVGDHLCGTVKYEMGLLYYEFDCEGATGQYVTVRKEGLLAVCEIVVHAPQ